MVEAYLFILLSFIVGNVYLSTQLDPNDGKTPIFLICISCDEAIEKQPDYTTQATGWVVARCLKEFQTLHSKLKDVSYLFFFPLLSSQ